MGVGAAAAEKALFAYQRFGLGPKPGGIASIAHSPKGVLLAELNAPNVAQITDTSLPRYATACREGTYGFTRAHAVFERELRARFRKAATARIGFVERLVYFWSNHFSMSVNKDEAIRATIGQLERDVIRQHVLGKFTDMLLGVMKHPAMIAYLDNAYSMGPRSVIGQAWGNGYNENLARELLELHTVGVDGGYTEDDIAALAKVITGWSISRGWEVDQKWQGATPQNRGQFFFRPDWHEPGPLTVMGKRYAQAGLAQGEAVLRDLAVHPKTAEHLAFKMVLHFITDTPTPAMVEPLKAAFLSSGGDLKAMAIALLDLPAAWNTPLEKVRPPIELAIAQFRAVSLSTWPANMNWAVIEPLRALNQMPWERGQPDGYPDESAEWLSPDAMRIRLETSTLFSWFFTEQVTITPAELAAGLFDDALSPFSLAAITRASDRHHAMSTLLMTPEFQRR